MPDRMPDFESPPVNEVVIGIQFQPLKSLKVQQIMKYWDLVRERYPRIEEQLPLSHHKEGPIQPDDGKTLVLKSSSPPPVVRFWLVSESDTELIQIQRDKFLRNWRQRKGDEHYPRFDSLFPAFWDEWCLFREFAEREELGEISVDQCEVSYVNNLDIIVDGEFPDLSSVFTIIHPGEKRFLPSPELVSFESRYSLPDGTGRLTVEMTPAFRSTDFKMIIQLSLTARGMASGSSDDAIKSWFQVAREWVVRGFTELTTEKMHEIWKRTP